ncbi:MAG: type II toxin-antitoxin system VapC family toxin [Acetobacteraceae bacterium]
MIRIVDASAIGAVLLVEPDANWINDCTEGMELVAPAILPFEIGNLCWKRLRRVPADAPAVMAIWSAWVASMPVTLVQPQPLATLQLAQETGLTYYDASYVRAAQEHDAALISLDAKLVRIARSLGLHAPSPHTTPRSRN